ncbi:ketopantoate reductase family protein [Pontibacter akesuensis]|uniref:2-dehydropantoate 2-reductase n=1 Tax=Pontibacter akesuensis TaxID=388950 RepID=A0A1I7FZT1_9BACT|nr:2-dehydropantoate 2-reductase [Pontibacter akesuensis]GHA59734.1 2-dehydropantoate 2-reductase [Pontibacter akesuensis]SFU41556.1 ketopantoate reductase [Pontibacter akesuensis]
MNKYKVAVIGIGGVGGYYGGILAQHFAHNDSCEISFVARGEHKYKIEQEGLKLELEEGTLVVHPHRVVEAPQDLGEQDLIIFCVKSYSLEQVCAQLDSSITSNTLLLPLLNGIEGIDYLQERFPEAKTLWGCVYIVASKAEPGVVKVQGKYNRLVWGHPNLPAEQLQRLQNLFQEAGINNELYTDAETKVWEKFSFISPVASLSSLTDKTMGELMGQEHLSSQLQQLMEELKKVAEAKGIKLPQELVAQNLEVVRKLPQEATSSMQRDFRSGNQTELENLTGYIVREGKEYGVETPLYSGLYQELKAKTV